MLEKRRSISPAMEDPEDCTVGESNAAEEEDEDEGEELVSVSDTTTATATASTTTTTATTTAITNEELVELSKEKLRDDLVKLPKEVRNLLAGGIAGMSAKSVVAPLDRIKILYQVSSAKFHLLNVPNVAKNIVQNEGLAGLWKGNTATMIRVFPYSGIQFTVYDRCKTYYLHKHERERQSATHISNKNTRWGLSPTESLVSGMLAGTVSVIFTYPLDLTRAQMAVVKRHRHAPNRGFMGVITDNYQLRGTQGLFRGITPTLIGILPYSGIAFALNEQAKQEIQHMTHRDLTTSERMQCGAFAGLIAQTVTYPIEVTRRRMQTIGLVGNDTALGNLGVNGQHAVERPLSLGATIRALYVEQGVRGFFKGVSMNWLKGPIAFSISFTTFDTVQSFMETESERAFKMPRRCTIGKD